MKNVLEDFGRHLKGKGLRFTTERRRLVETILGMKGHFSPEDVIERVRNKKVPVSRATVYRIIPVLVEAALIQQSLLSEGQNRLVRGRVTPYRLFEVTWNKDHHDHLICSQCDRVIEFQHNSIEILQREIANRYGFILDRHVMELVGRCKDCRHET